MQKHLLLFFGFLLSFHLYLSHLTICGVKSEIEWFDHALEQPSVVYELEKYNDNQYVINRLQRMDKDIFTTQ